MKKVREEKITLSRKHKKKNTPVMIRKKRIY